MMRWAFLDETDYKENATLIVKKEGKVIIKTMEELEKMENE
mgnify:CR=1 FL=1